MVTKKEIEKRIINWLKKRDPNLEVNKKSDLYNDGLLDSFRVFELVHELETYFCFQFTDDDFKHPNFKTINGMIELIINRKNTN